MITSLRTPDRVLSPRILPEPIRQFSVRLRADQTAADFPFALPPDLLDAHPVRRLHYAAGRYCAARAIETLDPVRPAPVIGRGGAGEPAWPPGIVGSITHSGEFVSAAAARSDEAAGVGIDTQEVLSAERLEHVTPVILLPSEIQRAVASDLGPALWTTVAFCAKEALYKCLYPIVGVRFYYTAAEVTAIDQREGTFAIALTAPLAGRFERGSIWEGQFELSRGYVHTGIWQAAVSEAGE